MYSGVCPAYVHIDKSRRRKLDDRAWKGVFVGYAADSPVWLVYNPRTRRVERSRNVDFDEMALMGSVSVGEKAPSAKDDDGVPVFFEEPVERSGCDAASGEPTSPSSASGESRVGRYRSRGSQVNLLLSSAAARVPDSRRLSGGSASLLSTLLLLLEPSLIRSRPRTSKRCGARRLSSGGLPMETEYDALTSRKTWRLVLRPAGRKLVDSKWI